MTDNIPPSSPGISNKGVVPLLFLFILLLTASIGGLVYFILVNGWFPRDGDPPKLTAAMVFRISGTVPNVLEGAPDQHIELITYRQRQTALLKSRLLLKNVLEQPEVRSLATVQAQAEPLEWLEKALSVDKGLGTSETRGSEFIRVSIEGTQADDLLVILRVLAKVYLADVDEGVKGSLRRQLAQWEDALRTLEAEINANEKTVADKKKAWDAAKRDEQIALDRVKEAKQNVETKNLFAKDIQAVMEKIAAKEPIRQDIRIKIELLRLELSAPSRVAIAEEPSIYKTK